jgi:hypothetical protein
MTDSLTSLGAIFFIASIFTLIAWTIWSTGRRTTPAPESDWETDSGSPPRR